MEKILHYLDEYLEEILMVISLIAMTLIMGIQVFSRYVLGMSLSWSEEITRYLFIWSAFLSVSLCTRKCISIKIDQFIQLFPRRGKAFWKVLNLTVEFVFFVYLIGKRTYQGYLSFLLQWQDIAFVLQKQPSPSEGRRCRRNHLRRHCAQPSCHSCSANTP